jgi:hypothetical protein
MFPEMRLSRLGKQTLNIFVFSTQKLKTGTKSWSLMFCALLETCYSYYQANCAQPLLLHHGKERSFISPNLPESPLTNLEAITTDSTVSYGPILQLRKRRGRKTSSWECQVGEVGIPQTRQLAGRRG